MNNVVKHLLSKDGFQWLLYYIVSNTPPIKRWLSDKAYLTILYRCLCGKSINWKNPQTFNEKLQWLKVYDHNPEYTKMVDKYEAKKYVASIIGEEYIIPTLGVWDSVDEIDWESLPKQFVLKCTHDSGGLVVCRDKKKLNMYEARVKISKSLGTEYYYQGREWPYKHVKPRVIAEQFMRDSVLDDIRDYKFFCFNGEPCYFKIDFDREVRHRANYYSINGELQKFGEVICPPDYSKKLAMPQHLDEMVEMAKQLSKNIPFVRVDFYEIDGHVYFGELTFYPAGGIGAFVPKQTDLEFGKLLILPNNKNKN